MANSTGSVDHPFAGEESVIRNALNFLANILLIPGKIAEIPGILVSALIVSMGNSLTKALTAVDDPTGITAELSSTITLYISVVGDLLRIPGVVAQIPGNIVHEFASIFRGAGFDSHPIIALQYRYDPKVDGVFDPATNLSTLTVAESDFEQAVRDKHLVLVDPAEGKVNSTPITTTDGINFYIFSTNVKQVFHTTGTGLVSTLSQHLFDPEFPDTSIPTGSKRIVTMLGTTNQDMEAKPEPPHIGPGSKGARAYTGSDLYVHTNNGLVFYGDPQGGTILDPSASTQNKPVYFNHPIIEYTSGGVQRLELNPFTPPPDGTYPSRLLPTGYLSVDDDPSILPPEVAVVFFSRINYQVPGVAPVPTGQLPFASPETWVAAYNSDGTLNNIFTPFTIAASQISAAWDSHNHRLVLVGNADNKANTPRSLWTVPVTGTGLAGVHAALQSFSQAQGQEINSNNRENQIYIIGGHPILISADSGHGVGVLATNSVDTLSNNPPRIIPQGLANDSYGASASLTSIVDPKTGNLTVTIHGYASIFNENMNEKNASGATVYRPYADNYTDTITFYPKPDVNGPTPFGPYHTPTDPF